MNRNKLNYLIVECKLKAFCIHSQMLLIRALGFFICRKAKQMTENISKDSKIVFENEKINFL